MFVATAAVSMVTFHGVVMVTYGAGTHRVLPPTPLSLDTEPPPYTVPRSAKLHR